MYILSKRNCRLVQGKAHLLVLSMILRAEEAVIGTGYMIMRCVHRESFCSLNIFNESVHTRTQFFMDPVITLWNTIFLYFKFKTLQW